MGGLRPKSRNTYIFTQSKSPLGKLCQHLCDLQTLYITKFQKKVDAPKRSEKEKETAKKLKSSQEEKEKSTKEKQNVVKKSSNDNATAASNIVEEISAQPSSSLADINEGDELSSEKQHLSQNPTTVSILGCTKKSVLLSKAVAT